MIANVIAILRALAGKLLGPGSNNTSVNNHKLRNWIGFWILGLSNHFAFFIMLAAAHDLLSERETHVQHQFCNPLGTGNLLIADAIPALTGIVLSPFMFRNTSIRIILVILLSFASYNFAGLSSSHVPAFAGVVCGSLACGFGEASILAYATLFEKEIVSGFSSGTGASSVVSSAVYMLLSIVLPTRTILLIMNIVPFLIAVAYFIIIVHPEDQGIVQVVVDQQQCQQDEKAAEALAEAPVTPDPTSSHLRVFCHGLWYAIPIFITTFSMYFVNQGLSELLVFHGSSMSQDMQYRLYSTISAVGVFISRSSVQLIQIDRLWIFPIVQVGVVTLILGHVIEPFLQSIYVVLFFIFIGGIIGGATYVNTFYKINKVCERHEKAPITSMALIGNEFAVATAGFVAIPAHDALCLFLSKRII